MTQVFPSAWAELLPRQTLISAYELWERAQIRRDEGETIFPPQSQIFRALDLTPPDSVRCIIVGQDPYHTPGVANGLAFSANPDCKIPPSLRNIFKELSADLGIPTPTTPDLTPWASQGVLLLNTSLTVRAGAAGSHKAWGWSRVTGEILRVCYGLPQPVMFLLWGRPAQEAARKAGIGTQSGTRKEILQSSHPSPLGASKGNAEIPAFFGSRPFSRTNAFLRSAGSNEIDWRL